MNFLKNFKLWVCLMLAIACALPAQATDTFNILDKTSPTITGGSISGVTSPLGIRSSGAAFDLQLGSSEALTANRLLQFIVNDGARNLTIPGNTTVPIATQTLTFSGPTAARTYTFPDASATLARTDAGNTFSGVNAFATGTVGAPSINLGSSTTGLYASGTDQIAFTGAGVQGFQMNSDGRVYFGDGSFGTNLAVGGATPGFQIAATGQKANIGITRWAASTAAPTLALGKSRGATVGTRGVITTGDTLGTLNFSGDDGTNFINSAQIQAVSTGTIGTNQIPSLLNFATMTSGGTLTTALQLGADQVATFTAGVTATTFRTGASSLTLTTGALGLSKMTASASAPGAGGAKLELVCGTNAGTAKLIIYAGTSTTPVTILDNIGAGVTGC